MQTIDRHIVSYVFGCLSGDFGEGYEATKEILKATEHKPNNSFLQAVLAFCKKYDMDDPDVQKSVAEVALEYFENPHKYDREKEVAVWSKYGENYFFTVHQGLQTIGIVISNDFDKAKSAVLKKFPEVTFVDASYN